MPVVQVALPVPLPRLFDYLPPQGAQPVIGGRVSVPFGNRRMIGIVVAFRESSDLPEAQLKRVIEVLDSESSIQRRCGASLTGPPAIIIRRRERY